jgi:hydroxypyruvate reductase
LSGTPLRETLLDCYQAAIAAVDARRCVASALDAERLAGEWHAVAIGKAAGAMMLGAVQHFGARLPGGVVVTQPGHVPAGLSGLGTLQVIESSHPQPDERSLAAGEAVAEYVSSLPRQANLLFLVSGGASSLIERLADGVTLADLRLINAWALASGRAIGEINAVRRAVSTIKGGGLAALAGPRRSLALLISDVPRDDPAVIGSGLLRAASRAQGTPALPADIERIVQRASAVERSASRVRPVRHRIVASLRDARRAAAACGESRGLEVRLARARYAGDAAGLGRRFARTVLAGPERTLHVWGGESTIILPAHPGYGGRSQHLALAAAGVLAGRGNVALLAAGTDGIDGVTDDAGASVDGGTVERGADAGFEAGRSLDGADSGRFLEASGDLLHTGPTLTNVGDLVLGLKGSRVA